MSILVPGHTLTLNPYHSCEIFLPERHLESRISPMAEAVNRVLSVNPANDTALATGTKTPDQVTIDKTVSVYPLHRQLQRLIESGDSAGIRTIAHVLSACLMYSSIRNFAQESKKRGQRSKTDLNRITAEFAAEFNRLNREAVEIAEEAEELIRPDDGDVSGTGGGRKPA